MASRLMIAALEALALIFLDHEQLGRQLHQGNRIRDWRTLFHVFLPTGVPQGLALENMVAASPAPCFQELADHEIYEMMRRPEPLQYSH